MKTKSAILLVRVSTQQQDYEAQIHDLKTYAKTKGYNSFKIIETKETGLADLEEKVGANEMFEYLLKNPKYTSVFATEISRLGRRQSVLHQIKEWFIQNDIQLYIKDAGYSLFDESGIVSAAGEMMFSLYGLFAESEIKQKADRYKRKRKELMEKGLSIGGKLLFGYDRFKTVTEKNTLVENKSNADTVRTLFNWYLNGVTSSEKNPSIKRLTIECIKRGFHPYTHSKRNVNKLLKEEAYTGFKITHNKRKNSRFGKSKLEPEYHISESKIKYPVIIERQLFDTVQKKLKSNIINGDKETKHITLLAKLINCPSCGRKLSANYRLKEGENRHSYRCTSRTDVESCKSTKSISMGLIDNSIWSLIKADLPSLSKKIGELSPNFELAQLEVQKQNLLSREKEIDGEILSITNTLSNFNKLKNIDINSFIDSQSKKLRNLDREKGKIEQEKAKLESVRLITDEKGKDIKSIIMANLSKIESSRELLKKYINSFVKEIVILRHNVQYSILRIKIQDYNRYTFFDQKLEAKKIYQYSYLIIDKRVTRQIKLIHYITNQEDNIYNEKAIHERTQLRIFERRTKLAEHHPSHVIPYTKLAI